MLIVPLALHEVRCSLFIFLPVLLVPYFKKIIPKTKVETFPLIFYSGKFIVSHLKFVFNPF